MSRSPLGPDSDEGYEKLVDLFFDGHSSPYRLWPKSYTPPAR